MLTIEHRIMDLLENRLRQYMVAGTAVYVSTESDNPILWSESISTSGTLLQAYPRAFELEITATEKCKITEVTLYASLGMDAPDPYSGVIDFVSNIPFVISNSGLSVTIKESFTVGMKWLLCASNASYSIGDISNKRIYDPNALPSPSLSLYAIGGPAENNTVDQKDYQLNAFIVLAISKEMYESGAQYEILGDLRDFINSDSALYDNSVCLATNVVYVSDQYFDLSDREDSIFKIELRINYSTKLTDARLK